MHYVYVLKSDKGACCTNIVCHREEAEGRRGDPVKSMVCTGLLRHFDPRDDAKADLCNRLKDGKHYIGSSRDPGKRLMKHNSGCVKSTKFGRPWKIMLEEKYITYTEARKRENFLKTGVGRKFIDKLTW